MLAGLSVSADSRCGAALSRSGQERRAEPRMQRRADAGVIERRGAGGPDHAARLDVGRDDHRRHAHAVIAEIEPVRIIGVGRDGRRRRHMVEAAAMLVAGDDEQRLGPAGAGPQRVVDLRDQLLGIGDVVRRVRVVGQQGLCQVGEIARLDEAVAGQGVLRRIGQELAERLEMGERIFPQARQRGRLRDVVMVDAPVDVGILQVVDPVEHGGHVERRVDRLVVDVAAGGAAMREEAVRPGLARRRGEPPVRHREGLRQPAQHRHLLGCEIMHHGLRVGRGAGLRLTHVVVDEAAHGRPVLARDVGYPMDLHVDVGEQFARIGIGNADGLGGQRIAVPDRDDLGAPVGGVQRVGLVEGQPIELRACRIQRA
jgi:hypothetical protein